MRNIIFSLTLMFLIALLTGCSPSNKDITNNTSDEITEIDEPTIDLQSETDTEEGDTISDEGEPEDDTGVSEPEDISLSGGVLSGMDRLEPTDKGFRKWDWGSLSSIDRFDPSSVNYGALFGDKSITMLEYWLSHGPEEPDMNKIERRWEYDAQGRLLYTKSYSLELGFEYWKRNYDNQGRLVRTEHRIAPEDTGFETAEIRQESSFTYDYFTLITGEQDIYRVTRDFSGKLIRIEYEQEVDSGWVYTYDNDYGGPVRFRVGFSSGLPSIITLTYPNQRNNTKVLSFEYNASNMIVRSVETKLDGSSPLFTTDYIYDEQGRLVTVSVWDHRKDVQGQIKSFSDYDEHGNWQRQVVTLDGKTISTIVRRIEYHGMSLLSKIKLTHKNSSI